VIRVLLTPEQIATLRKTGSVGVLDLSAKQAASVRAQLNQLHARSKTLSCECGECKVCKTRERVRVLRAEGRYYK
jgi:hypothetical protein